MAAQFHIYVDPNGAIFMGMQRSGAAAVGEVRLVAASSYQAFVTDQNLRGVAGLQGASVIKVARRIESEATAGRVSYLPDAVVE